MDIQTTSRATLSAVGTREDFIAATASFCGFQQDAELALARMVAFAYATYWRGGEDKTFGLDHIRETVKLAKDQARRLGNALSRITRTAPGEGVSPAKAALKFANEFVADFYSHETKARLERKAKAQAAKEEKAKQAAKEAADKLKAIKAEAKAEAEAELTVDVVEFTLIGRDGSVTALTEDEYTYLAITLDDLRHGKAPALKIAS